MEEEEFPESLEPVDTEDEMSLEELPEEEPVEFLDEDQLLQRQQLVVKSVSDLLDITPSAACLVLRHFSWDYQQLTQEYFEDPAELRRTLGISLGKVKPYHYGKDGQIARCGICIDDVPSVQLLALACGHSFCSSCWKNYLAGKVQDGSSCTLTHCPFPKCTQVCDEAMFQELLDEELFSRYRKFVIRTYVEDNPHITWCPGRDCGMAVISHDTHRLLVRCVCGHRFCFMCKENAHAPARCDDLRDWLSRERGEGENSKWVLCNTKPCPKCQSPIEKNDGCNHMTCSKCRHEFCWICLGTWSQHGSSWYKCNLYDPSKKEEEEKTRGEARKELQRYVFYYERYLAHHKSKAFNEDDVKRATEKAEQMQKAFEINAEYIVKAMKQIVENREMLQYTYVYAFYLDPKVKTRELFEFNQATLEKTTEDFNVLMRSVLKEANLGSLLHNPTFSRDRIVDMTAIAQNMLHKLLQGVFCEDGDEERRLHRPSATFAAKVKGKKQRNLSPVSRPAVNERDEKLSQLMAMGFPVEQSSQALDSCDGNVTQAAQLLLAIGE
eukprot:RCo035000